MTTLQIEITTEELHQLEQAAQEQGFDSVEAYVRSLVIEPTKAELLNDIREGLLAVKRGDPMPNIDDLWAELEADDEITS